MLQTLWRALFKRNLWESDLDDELRAHLAERTEDLLRSGLSGAEAERQARLEFGPTESYKEEIRQASGFRWFDELLQDLRYATRVLRRNSGFTIVAVISLALGIGANTVAFSVVNSLLLRGLPIRQPERVFFVNHSGKPTESFPNYRDLRDRNSVFETLMAYRLVPVSLDQDGGARRVWGFLATGNYFEALGLQPAMGRFFTSADDKRPNESPYAVISYACWQSRFAGAPDIAGRSVRINGHPYTVLGVAPRGFHGTEQFYWAEIWIPMMMQAQIEGRSWLNEPAAFNAWMAGRLKPGVTPAQAESNLAVLSAQLIKERSVNEGMALSLSTPGMAGSMGREPTRTLTSGVMLLAMLVLLAACANLASLQTARAADRLRDLSIRLSIGAGRARIVRQLLTESILLSALGGAAGCVLAVLLLRLISDWHAPLDFPVQFDVTADWRVFVFACVAALVTGVLSGLGPAAQAWKSDPVLGLKGLDGARRPRRWAARDLLLPVQVALCCILVTASFVSLRGMLRSFQSPLGFQPDGVAVAGYDVGIAGYEPEAGKLFEERAVEAAQNLPGVQSAAYASAVPLSIDQATNGIYPEKTTDFRPKNRVSAAYFNVSPSYFRTAGTKLIAGREFSAQDDFKSPRVLIVNQTLARRLTGTDNAVGHAVLMGEGAPVEIVGVVEDGKYQTLTESPANAIFFSIRQHYSSTVVLLARSSRSEVELAAELRQALAGLDPHLPAYGVGAMRQMLGLVYLPMHAALISLGSFGLLAIMLSITGIYGIAAYTVSRRSREIGIRMAVGARPAQVLRLVFGRTGVLVGLGALVGLALGVASARLLASIVYQASSRDPVVIIATVLAMAVVGLAATLDPARRAIRVDPTQALRQD